MKIRMKSIYAGPLGTIDAGAVRDVPDADGKALVDGGYADELKPIVRETATLPPPPETRLADMTRAQIDAFAKTKGIDTSGAGTKAEAIALIEAGKSPLADRPLDELNHDELIALAAEKGVSVDGAPDDAAIRELLKQPAETK